MTAAIGTRFNTDNLHELLQICLVTDVDYLNGFNLPELIDAVLRAGVTMIRLHPNDMSAKEFYLTAQQIKGITDKFQIPLIIYDRVDIALAVDAAGVHLDSRSFPVSKARKIFFEGIIGYTVERMADLDDAHQGNADYIELYPVFQSNSIPDTDRLWLAEGIDMVLYRTELPVMAGGGITEHNAGIAGAAGAAGIAVSAALMSSTRPLDAAEELREAFLQKYTYTRKREAQG